MKFSRVFPAALISLISTSAIAGQFPGQLNVIDGHCKLEVSKEVITIVNRPAYMNYGKFAEGTSAEGDRIHLTQNFPGYVYIHISSKEQGSASAQFALNPNSPTNVNIGLAVRSNSSQSDWLTCELKVK